MHARFRSGEVTSSSRCSAISTIRSSNQMLIWFHQGCIANPYQASMEIAWKHLYALYRSGKAVHLIHSKKDGFECVQVVLQMTTRTRHR